MKTKCVLRRANARRVRAVRRKPVARRSLPGWEHTFLETPADTLIRLDFYDRAARDRLSEVDAVTAAAFAV